MSAPAVRRPAVDPPVDPAVPPYLADDPGDRRRLRVALAAALAAHLPLLLLPDLGGPAAAAPPEPEEPVFVMHTPRFLLPPPPAAPPDPLPPRQEAAVRIPIPDPTPADPEPVREVELPPAPEPLPANVVFFEPDPPPAPPAPPPAGELRVGGDVARPERLFAPHPAYTEAARRVHVEGMVILEVRLDETGAVSRVEVLKGLPLGLTESAVEAVSRWRYQPARLNGEPVPVLMTVTIRFELD